MAASPPGGASEPGSAHSCNTLLGGMQYLVQQVPAARHGAPVLTEAQMSSVLSSMETAHISKATVARLKKTMDQMRAAAPDVKPEQGEPRTPDVLQTPPPRPSYGTPRSDTPPLHQHPVNPAVPLQMVKTEPVHVPSHDNTLAKPVSCKSAPHTARPSLHRAPSQARGLLVIPCCLLWVSSGACSVCACLRHMNRIHIQTFN